MVQSGAELPQSVMNLAKADLNDKKRVKTQKVEREELQTKVPKKNPLAVKKVKTSDFFLDFKQFFLFILITFFSLKIE